MAAATEPHNEGNQHEEEVAALRASIAPIARGRRLDGLGEQRPTAGRRAKVLYVVRHGQAEHNAAAAASGQKCDCAEAGGRCPYIAASLEDPKLTAVGRDQAAALAPQLADAAIELVVISPLQRALETAQLALLDAPRARPALACEDCREQNGQHLPDRRRPASVIAAQFPAVDCSLIAEHDALWQPSRETKSAVAQRACNFIKWLFQREEQVVALVAHSAFILVLLNLPVRIEPVEGANWFQPGEARAFEIELIDDN